MYKHRPAPSPLVERAMQRMDTAFQQIADHAAQQVVLKAALEAAEIAKATCVEPEQLVA